MVRSVFVLLPTLLLLVSAPLTSRAQEATPQPALTTSATPVASNAAITSEVGRRQETDHLDFAGLVAVVDRAARAAS